MAGILHLAKAGSSPKLRGALSSLMQRLFSPGHFQAWLRKAGEHPQKDSRAVAPRRSVPGEVCVTAMRPKPRSGQALCGASSSPEGG